MNPTKKKLLKIAHQRVLAVTLMDLKAPLKWVDEYVSESVTGFGTAADEKFFSKKDYLGIVLNSRKQAKGLFFSCKLKTKYAPRFTGENSACFFDEFTVCVGKGTQQMVMQLSVGLVFNYYDNNWKLIALHASKIDTDTSSTDTFHLGEAEKKMQELQMEVAKRTEELSQKNNELKIEAALERVRAVAMAMQQPHDMQDMCKTIAAELVGLSVKNITLVETIEIDQKRKCFLDYEYYPISDYKSYSVFHYKKNKGFTAFVNTLLAHENSFFYSGKVSGVAFNNYIKLLKTVPAYVEPAWLKNRELHFYFQSAGIAALGFVSSKPLAESEIALLKRFRNVFYLAYQRYTDIKLATAQAREAQIEAALERVRAKSMAMQQPNELRDVAELLRKEMGALGIEALETSSIYLVHPRITECWYAIKDVRQKNTKLLSDYMEIQLGETWVGREMQKFYKGKQKQASIVMKGIHRKEWINYCASKSSGLKNYYGKEIPERTYHVLKFTGGYMGAVSPGELSEENWDILRRATAVFALAYTRFKDLQEAADRAREAEIELALERVRARSMAMHKSGEIMEVVYLIADQLKDLRIESDATSIIILHDDAYEYWNANNQQTYDNSQLQKIDKKFDGAVNQDFIKFSKLNKDYTQSYSRQEKNKHWKWLFASEGGFRHIPEERKKFILAQPHYTIAGSFTKKISLLLVKYQTAVVFNDAERAILKRFTEVFYQCYTRFLDLQKAEAQAREAQIEVGLERVRSRAMAMQSSEELKVLIATVFNELTKLDLALTRCIIWVFEPSTKAARWWMANSEEPSNPMTVYVKYHEHPAYLHFVDGWEKQNVKFVYDLKGKDKISWDHILFNETELKLLPDAIKSGMQAPERVLLSASFNNFGGINVASIDPLSDEHFDILLRFAKVFDLTYTRFLDLQKAEAQAREAKIEAALEKIRSRSLAMHKSDELSDVVAMVFQQLNQFLFLTDGGVSIVTEFKAHEYADMWVAADMLDKPELVRFPYTQNPIPSDFTAEKLKGTAIYSRKYDGPVINENWKLNFQMGLYKDHPKEFKQWILSRQILHFTAAFEKHSAITVATYINQPPTEEQKILLQRFAKVFEQTYIRFLDLQKAEAQAREAKIEAALERVRSRSLAMHKSDELQEVVTTVFDQLHVLNIENDATGIIIFQPNTNHFQYWFANSERSISSYFLLEYKKFSFTNELGIAHQNGEPYFHKVYSKKEKNEFYSKILTETDFVRLSDERKKLILASEGFTLLAPLNKNTALQLNRYYKKPFADTDIEVAKRFSNVFEQAYIRFLDLQKAEEQAREAEIQLALERVRARSLAMHSTAELHEMVNTVFEQLGALGFNLDGSAIVINLFKEGSKDITQWIADTNHKFPYSFHHPYFDNAILNDIQHAREKKLAYFSNVYDYKEKNKFWRYYFKHTDFKRFPPALQKEILAKKSYAQSMALEKHSGILNPNIDGKVLDESQQTILQRFAKVFEQSYVRYLDLQKAEAQAKEAQIQLALERVRARTMAMQKSDELIETSFLLFQQMKDLGETAVQNSIAILKEEEGFVELSTTVQGQAEPKTLHVPMDDPHIMAKAVAALKAKKKSLIVEIKGKELKEYNKFRNSFLERKANFPEDNWIVNIVFFSKGWLSFSSNHKISDESFRLLERFGVVFEQTYTRFLDLQKAEAQAREAKIEASLERVRSHTMGLRKSEELIQVINVIFEELKNLGLDIHETSILLRKGFSREFSVWGKSVTEDDFFNNYDFPFIDHPILNEVIANLEQQKSSATFSIGGKDLVTYLDLMFSIEQFKGVLPETKAAFYALDKVHIAHAYFQHGFLEIAGVSTISEELVDIAKRFTQVIDLAYTRFLDLQKAEEQAREAQIEASLEKVRSVAMSMHHSNELLNICEAIYAELIKLGMIELRNTMINIHNDAEETFLNYDYSAYAGRAVTKYGYHIHPIINHLVMQCRSAQDAFVDIAFDGKEFEEWRSFRKASGEKDDARLKKITHLHYYFYSIGIGSIGISTFESIDEQKMALIKRFRNVFQLAYQRFTDLSAAEAQAREAQIETALERVRSRTMAMQNSSELSAAVQVMFEECRKLQPAATDNLSRGFITTIHQNKKIFDLWITEIDGTKIDARFKIAFDEPTTGIHLHKAWKQKKPYFINDLQGPVLDQWLDYLESTGFKIAPGIRGTRRVNTFIFYSNGFIGITSSVPIEEENIQILQRFAKVFDQTYTRFLDLQKAEAAAKEAIKQAALDRIRADIASMRTIEDLNRITPLIWNELTILGIPFIRCGVFIMDEEVEQIHTFLSTPDGKSIAAFHLSFTESENIIDIVSHWRNKKVYSNHWDEGDFDVLADSLVKQKAITTKSTYLQSIPTTGIHLNFLPFLQGMLYVGNELPLKPDEIHLLQAVADAFSTAYARYEDFNKLEVAKQVVEKTLNELKSTQQQLIQSEKMASLGELTAGIAHEIQNPLNFVNNFSEVSKELVDELQAERIKPKEARDEKLETDILNDVVQNLEKINHHGKRASDIVKGMLQHSRKSEGKKEPTDINALCDEYLRLAYHGLRAKDKSFNAKLETEFDSNIEKINIIPQDIGRVILNLINNAFYAVSEKKKIEDSKQNSEVSEKYEPTVIVKTSKNSPMGGRGAEILISVKDNGNGIPANIKEKIFQPFFTTKPTGQGTGLGLSLSYDIIKAHTGELKVETKEGAGTEFIIQIPLA